MRKIKLNNKPGFTLLELMIVVVIIAILSTVAFVNYEKAKVKSRDTERKTDIAQLSIAMTGYFADQKSYKIRATTFGDISTVWEVAPKLSIYLSPIPTDPNNADPQYKYMSDDGTQYKIYATSEGITSNPDSTAQTKAGDYYDPTDNRRFQISTSTAALAW